MECVVEVTSLDDCYYRSENLLVEALHVFGYIDVDMRPHVDTFAGVTMEFFWLVVVGYSTLTPYLLCTAGFAHLYALEEVNRVLLRQHRAV